MLNTVSGGAYLWQNFRLFSSLLLQVLFYFRQRKIIPQKVIKPFFLIFRVEGKKKKATPTCWIIAWEKKEYQYGPDYNHFDLKLKYHSKDFSFNNSHKLKYLSPTTECHSYNTNIFEFGQEVGNCLKPDLPPHLTSNIFEDRVLILFTDINTWQQPTKCSKCIYNFFINVYQLTQIKMLNLLKIILSGSNRHYNALSDKLKQFIITTRKTK